MNVINTPIAYKRNCMSLTFNHFTYHKRKINNTDVCFDGLEIIGYSLLNTVYFLKLNAYLFILQYKHRLSFFLFFSSKNDCYMYSTCLYLYSISNTCIGIQICIRKPNNQITIDTGM